MDVITALTVPLLMLVIVVLLCIGVHFQDWNASVLCSSGPMVSSGVLAKASSSAPVASRTGARENAAQPLELLVLHTYLVGIGFTGPRSRCNSDAGAHGPRSTSAAADPACRHHCSDLFPSVHHGKNIYQLS